MSLLLLPSISKSEKEAYPYQLTADFSVLQITQMLNRRQETICKINKMWWRLYGVL